MTTEESESSCDLNIYFVIPAVYGSEDECTEDMWHAFNKCCDNELEPVWITEKKCAQLMPRKKDVFVMEKFDGEVFQKLQSSKRSIVGPRCLLICFINAEPIPEGTSPVFTTAMRGLVVCASGLTPGEKNDIEQTVEYMGGIYTKELRNSCTHLITNSVLNAKYEKATEMKIPIMTEKWVKAVWDVNLRDFVRADDSMFDGYKCPVFSKLVVTSTNLPKRIKEEIRDVIDKNGGTFMGALDGSKVKVVLAPKDSMLSDKLKYAMQNNIACLRPDWVFESIKVGYALPFQSFLIKSTKASSTPEKVHAHETLNISSISTIQSDGNQRNYIDESAISTISTIGGFDQTVTADAPNAGYMKTLDRLSLNDAKTAGPFLDGCCIYLAGFAANHKDKINRILNVGNATRLNDVSDAVTHVLVGNGNKAAADLKLVKSIGSGPFILSLRWLEESLKLKRPAPEECFLYEEMPSGCSEKPAEPPSPLSKRSLQMLRKIRKPSVPSFRLDAQELPRESNRDADLIQQYLQGTVVAADRSLQHIFRAQPSEGNNSGSGGKDRVSASTDLAAMQKEQEEPPTKFEYTGQSRMSTNDSMVPVSQRSSTRGELFEGLTFIVIGFSEDERRNLFEGITSLGGTIVSNAYSGIPDFGIVPVAGAPLKHTVNEIVTNLYIDDCLLEKKLVEIMYYHRPLTIKRSTKPLSACVITMSMYTGAEREFLAMLAVQLGARCQDTFARKTNAEKETYASTHLICPTPEGNKYNAAVKWKLPAVSADWLLECVRQAKHVDETGFLVGETVVSVSTPVPDRIPAKCGAERNSTAEAQSKLAKGSPIDPLQNVITPRRPLPQPQSVNENRETPLVNKRLSLVAANSTPQSPFHVSTPGTPYGQVFKPNPSPATRKGWLEYVDDMLDIKVDEPPLKRRLPSTPMSELRRQFWSLVKKPINNDPQPDTDESLSELPTDVDKDSGKTDNATPIKRRLDYQNENSPLPNVEFDQQIVQLQEALERTSTTADSRQSLSGENPNRYYLETADHIENCLATETQPYSVRWEDPVKTSMDAANPEPLSERDNAHGFSRSNKEEQGNGSDGEGGECVSAEANNILSEAAPLLPPTPAPPARRKFMLSGIKDKSTYEKAITKLCGDVSTEANFDSSATHLLCFRPSRNEKMLASIAAGKWVLHFIYLQDSEKFGRFVDEEKYEWGNPKSKGIIPEPEGPTEHSIAAATYRWRLKLSIEPATARGAFLGMVALLLVSSQKYDQFKRLIEAGGGTVVRAKPPYDTTSGRKITHCFVTQLQQQVDWAMMANKNILCFLPQYLCDYLTAETPLNPQDCVIPDFKKYLTLLPKYST